MSRSSCVVENRPNMKTDLLALSLIGFYFALPDLVSATVIDDNCPPQLVNKVDEEYLKIFLDNSTCFWFNLDDRKIYAQAKMDCEQYGGTLAIPKFKELNDFLVESLAKDELNYKNPLWIGLNDLEMEGIYKWDDGSTLDWTNFDKNNGGYGGDGEDCLALEPKGGTWHDFNCEKRNYLFTSPKKAFICQFQITPLVEE